MIAQMLTDDLGLYYLVGLLIMLVLIGQIAHDPFANRLLGDPHPMGYVLVVLVLAFVWPVVLAEVINNNDRGRH